MDFRPWTKSSAELRNACGIIPAYSLSEMQATESTIGKETTIGSIVRVKGLWDGFYFAHPTIAQSYFLGWSQNGRVFLCPRRFGRNVRPLHDHGAAFFVGRRLSAAEALIGSTAFAQQLAGFFRITSIELRKLRKRDRQYVAVMKLIAIDVFRGVEP